MFTFDLRSLSQLLPYAVPKSKNNFTSDLQHNPRGSPKKLEPRRNLKPAKFLSPPSNFSTGDDTDSQVDKFTLCVVNYLQPGVLCRRK